MSKGIKLTIGFVMVLVLMTAGFLLLNSSEDTSVQQSTGSETQIIAQSSRDDSDEAPQESINESRVTGEYVEYSDEVFNASANTDRVLFFHAEWCSTCKFFEQSIETAGVPDGITILEVDYDTNTELKNQYDVSVQSTFVLVDENNDVIETWPFANGLRSADDLYAAVNES